jgi:predicted GNAT family acetyltransferase
MDLERIRQRLDDERRYLARDGETLSVGALLTRIVHGPQRMVAWSSLDEASADAAIAGELAQRDAQHAALEWKLYGHDRPADLLSRLQHHGLVAGAPEAVMVYDLSAGPPAGAMDEGVVTRIRQPEQIEQFRRVAEALREDSSDICRELADAVERGSTQHLGYVAYCGTEPVAIARLYTHPLSAFGGLYGGATRAGFRRRGYYRALIAARSADAIELGARYLLVDALPTSRPILERLGFQHLTDTIPCLTDAERRED